MRFTDKKFTPYYIAAIILLSLSIIAVLIATYYDNDKEEEIPPVEIITYAEPSTLFMNGEVPYYPDIPASAFVKDKFESADGRIVYNDKTVSYSTGVDVSSFQGDIDWKAVADDGIDFAIIRVAFRGYGVSGSLYIDDKGETNIKGALRAGLEVGVYIYSQAITVEEAIEEAEFVLDIIDGYDITGPVVFDWENDPGVGMRTDNLDGKTLTDCAVMFCKTIKKAGYTPAVYFNLTDAYERYDLDKIKDYVLWFAQHEGTYPNFYYAYNIWQYSDSGKVDGIDGNVDLNIKFNIS